MTVARRATIAVLVLRLAYAATLLVAPARFTQRWLGPAVTRAPTQVALRGLGIREGLLHAGALAAALRGAPVRPWLAASIAGDLTDIASTVAGRGELPEGAATATALVAGGSAALSAAVAAADDA